MGIIYCARNLVNGKRYIGQTVQSLYARRFAHEYSAKTNRNGDCRVFSNALRKYGIHSFEWSIIFDNVKEHDLNELEIDAITTYRSLVPNGYNLKEGGSNGRPSEESRKRMSDSQKKRIPSLTPRPPISEETRKKISEGGKGKKRSEETKRKISEAQKRRAPVSEETRKKQSEIALNRSEETKMKMKESNKAGTPEVRAKISLANQNKSPETLKRMSEAQKNRQTPEVKRRLSEAQKRRWDKYRALKLSETSSVQ